MDVPGRIDHTVLGPETTGDDVSTVLDEASEYGMNACIPPCYVDEATEYTSDVTIATVVGFPHGQHATSVKCQEAETAWTDGADEIDMVANTGLLKRGEDEQYRHDIEDVVASVPIPVKVIIEAPLLSDDELQRACTQAASAGAAFVKTATGFTDGGAAVQDVERMSEHLPVKASGGIDSWEKANALLEAGADRIGASSGVTIIKEWQAATTDDDETAGDKATTSDTAATSDGTATSENGSDDKTSSPETDEESSQTTDEATNADSNGSADE